MSGPSVATTKRLFAVSGNVCAFPGCEAKLVDQGTGKVLGKICHIKGNRSGAGRHDPDQRDEERHGFENLLIMCPVHHDVIDADPESYTVDRLQDIKTKHEASYAAGNEPTDEVAEGFIASLGDVTVLNGSVITTRNQMGGQVAHSIVNVGKQPRRITQAAANQLIAELRKHPSEEVDVTSLMGDAESFDLAQVLEHVLKEAGWQSSGVAQALFSGVPRGIILETAAERASIKVFGNWLMQVGLKVQGVLKPSAEKLKVIVGAAE